MDTQEYIGFWKRFAAAFIDSLLILVVTLPLTWVIYGDQLMDMSEPRMFMGPADILVNWVLPIVLIISFWSYRSATPGKMLFEAVIVDANSGGKPSMRQWILRYLGYFLSTLPLCLGFLWVAWDKRKQGWHDKIAGTVVVAEPYS